MPDVNRTTSGFLTDQQRSSLRWLKHPTRGERLALRIDELFRLVGGVVGRWNARVASDRRYVTLKYGCSATLANWGKPTLAVLGAPHVHVRVDDDFTGRQFEFRFDTNILEAPEPEEYIRKSIEQIANDLDYRRHEAWSPYQVDAMAASAEEDARIAESN